MIVDEMKDYTVVNGVPCPFSEKFHIEICGNYVVTSLSTMSER